MKEKTILPTSYNSYIIILCFDIQLLLITTLELLLLVMSANRTYNELNILEY